MKHSLVAGLLVFFALSPAQAQRAPLFGSWFGPIQCGPDGGRLARLFMYGDGTGLLELGVPSYAPQAKPSVAMVSLRQPPEADYILIDHWTTSGNEPALQLAGRLGPDGAFSGQVLNDPRCGTFALQFNRQDTRSKLLRMRRDPVQTALREGRLLDPHITATDIVELGALGWALSGGLGGGGGGSGGSAGVAGGPHEPDYNAPALPSVGGNIHGNPENDIHGNPVNGRGY